MDFGESYSRRLPIYLVLDTSRSMRGEPIQAVNQGLVLIKGVLLEEPTAVETVYLSIITFSTEAEQIVPLTDLFEFEPPELVAGGWSNMGAALQLVGELLDREIIPNTPESKGDYRPLAFLMTDGRPSDAWKRITKALRNRTGPRLGNLIALGCGPKADMDILGQVADVALLMEDASAAAIREFFQWVSQSIGVASLAASVRNGGAANLPPLPEHIKRIVA